MQLPAGDPGVNIQEINLSTFVPAFPGVYGGIVIQARTGPVNQPQLITNQTQLLNVFTPLDTISVVDDIAFFSALAFLQKSSTIWVVRAANSSLYGGLSVRTSSSSYSANPLAEGFADPDDYVFDSNPDVPAVAQKLNIVFSQVGTFYDVVGAAKAIQLYDSPAVGHYFWFFVEGGTNVQTDPMLNGTGHEVVISQGDSATAAQIAVEFYNEISTVSSDFIATNTIASQVVVTNVVPGACTAASVTGSAATITVVTPGADAINADDELFLVYGTNQGAWDDLIAITIINYADNKVLVPDPNTFVIQVYYNGATNPVETWTCSRTPGYKDGFGNNTYIQNVLQGSAYILALDNTAFEPTVLPKSQLTPVNLGGGDDGVAVTDSQMVTALQTLSNPDQNLLTVMMDGAHATVTYQQAIDAMVSTRQDSVGLFTTPFSAESASSYITEILAYRNTTLNLNSSYSALYTPAPLIFDQYNDRQIYVGPDGYAGAAISFSAANYEIWFPPAGFRRGLLSQVLGLRRQYTAGEMATLYNNGINPIRFAAGTGIAIWGQKTLSSIPSALNRLNVRLLLITIEPAIAEALQNFVFEINDTETQNSVTSLINSYLRQVVANQGLYAFTVVCNATNNPPEVVDQNQMIVAVYVQPTKSAEFITLQVIITATGVTVAA
jgi:phage tail sheath protein FI